MADERQGGELLLLIKDNYGLISGVLLFACWIGRLTQMVNELRKRPEGVTIISCRRQQTDCIALIDAKLSQGSHNFGGLETDFKQLRDELAHEAQINETRHNMIINHLLELQK